MQPVYFLPNVPQSQVYAPMQDKLNRKTLDAHGLLGIFGDLRGKEDTSISDAKVKGASGCLLAYGAPDKFTRPDTLEWLEGETWIGWDKDNPPTEADLKRKRKVPGYSLEMEDGSSWQVPILRRPDDTTNLPCDMFYDEAGRLQEPVKEAYREYWEATAEVASFFFDDSDDGKNFTKAKAFDLAVKALGINYRFGHQEQRITRVVSSVNVWVILAYTVDYHRQRLIRDLSKKNLLPPDTANTTPGSPAESETTAQVEQTSGSAL